MQKLIISFLIIILFVSLQLKAQDIFVKVIDGSGTLLEGESLDRSHPNEIIASSYGQQSSGCVAGGIPCRATTGNFIFNMSMSKPVNLLRKSMYLAAPLRSVDIVFRKAGASLFEYYKIHLENVLVTGISEGVSAGSINEMQISLDPQKFHWTYIPQSASGTAGTPVKFGYDKSSNTEFIF